MYFGYAKGLTSHRTLDADDVKGVCFLYSAAGFTCATDADCPFYQGTYGGADVATRCNATNCTTGAAGYGAACDGNGDCTSSKCLLGLDAAPAGQPGICTQTCIVSPNNCPNGALCHADTTSAGLGNVCYPSYVDCVPDSECVAMSNGYCVHDLDGRFRCIYTCLLDAHCTAIPGAICQGAVDAGRPGFCRVPGSGGDGVACQDGYDCASLYCSGTAAPPVCGRNATPMDSGPTPDGAVADDGGGPADGAATDPSGGGDRQTRSDVDPPIPEEGTALVGGCACAGSDGTNGRDDPPFGGAVAVGGLVAVPLMIRRRRRRASKTHRVD
jgi:MYXO-CTERM domain-containing protein